MNVNKHAATVREGMAEKGGKERGWADVERRQARVAG